MGSRPLTPPCIPFGTRRFNNLSAATAPSSLSVSSVATLHALLLLSVSNIPSQEQPTCVVFCGLCIASPSLRFKDYYCSALLEDYFFNTMASADFLQFVVTTDSSACKTSPVKSSNLPLIYPSHLHRRVRAVLDFALLSKLVRSALPYM